MLDHLASTSKKGQLSPNTQKRNVSRLKSVFQWWYDNNYLGKLPSFPKVKGQKARRPHFDDAEMLVLTEAMKRFVAIKHGPVRRDRMMLVNYVQILANTGLRTGEAEKLRWKDVEKHTDEEGTSCLVLSVPKGKTQPRKAVAFMETEVFFANILDIRKADLLTEGTDIFGKAEVPKTSYIFCHPSGAPIRSFKKSFASLLEEAGLTLNADGQKRTPYSMRHTYATSRLNETVQEYHLAQNMGTSVGMLEQHYGHTSNVSMAKELTKRKANKPVSKPSVRKLIDPTVEQMKTLLAEGFLEKHNGETHQTMLLAAAPRRVKEAQPSPVAPASKIDADAAAANTSEPISPDPSPLREHGDEVMRKIAAYKRSRGMD